MDDFSGFKQSTLEGILETNIEARAAVAYDWGGIVSHVPAAVLHPATASDIATMLRYCGQHGLQAAPRGTGTSTGGLSQIDSGLIVDLSSLNAVALHINGDKAVAQVGAGALWNSVLEESLRYSLMPPVTPYGGELGFLSVGGVLATGGANSRSVTYGLMSDNVARLEVVTGAGETLTCSPSDRADLFFAALGGYGQSAIITQATLELIPAPKNVRVYWLFHHTMQEAIHALRSALAEGIWDQADVLGYQHSYTDAIRAPSPRDGELINTLRLTAFHRESPPDDEALLRNFRSHFSIRIEDVSFRDSLLKKRAFYDLLDREKVRMQGPHRGVAIPDDNMEAFLSALLEKFPLDRVGPYWHVHCVPISGPVGLQTPLFRLPAAESWGVVCPWLGMAQEHSPQASRDLYQLALDNGGMLLGGLTGWPMLPDDWKAYFGPAWNELQRAKHKYDPNNVLQSLTNTG